MKLKYKLIFISIVILSVFFIKIYHSNSYKQYLISISLEEIQEKIDNKDSFVLLVGKEDCPACNELYPKIQNDILDKKETIFFYEINSTNRELDLDSLLNLFPDLQFVPYASYIKDGIEVKNILPSNNENNYNELWENINMIKK